MKNYADSAAISLALPFLLSLAPCPLLFVCFVYNLIFLFIFYALVSVQVANRLAAPCITSYWLLASLLSDAIRRNLSYRLCQAAAQCSAARLSYNSIRERHNLNPQCQCRTMPATNPQQQHSNCIPAAPAPSPVNWTLSLSCVLVI